MNRQDDERGWSDESAGVRTRPAGRGGLRRLVFWVIALVAVLLVLFVVAAVVIGVLILTNAQAALSWVNDILNQLRSIIPAVPQLPGEG